MAVSLADYPIYRGYPWGFSFCKLRDAGGNSLDFSTVTRAKCNLFKGPLGIGKTPALVCDSTISPYRIAYNASITVSGDGTYPGYVVTLTESDTLALTPGKYWFVLELIRAGSTDDLPPLLVQVPVIAAGRAP